MEINHRGRISKGYNEATKFMNFTASYCSFVGIVGFIVKLALLVDDVILSRVV